MPDFDLVSDMEPAGDQPDAINELVEGLERGDDHQTLLGVTGSGKTFTMANVIERVNRPVLVISHNKTLAAQLFSEFQEFFPNNAVEYFVSYYDYYQPEAYIPQRDIYIEKDAGINESIDRLRLKATSSLMSRDDVLIVASVSCIYGLGSPEDYNRMTLTLDVNEPRERRDIIERLVDLQYERNEYDFDRGTFRARGDVIEIFPSYETTAIKVEMFDTDIEKIYRIDPVSEEIIEHMDRITIFPALHFVTPEKKLERAINRIREELKERLKELRKQDKLLEAQRLEARTEYDLEMLEEVGFCQGIENYSRHLSGREKGERPYCLLDYFPDDFVTIVDESHMTIPQIGGMYEGDRSRKETLVEHGFRLPSAMDNRPLQFDEWEELQNQVMYMSATPGDYEVKKCKGDVVEQIIRPTGLVDPKIEVRPAEGQVQDLFGELKDRAEQNEGSLVTTLTKRMAEDLSEYLQEEGINAKYLHDEIKTIERVQILNELRNGEYDVIVGVNLLREGLDLPEVTLVAILDADREGFLRSETSIIQTVGRAARNEKGSVILYADEITGSMQRAMDETERRREKQLAYNEEHDIDPETIQKEIKPGIEQILEATNLAGQLAGLDEENAEMEEIVGRLEQEMYDAAEDKDFERAAEIRDTIDELKSGDRDKSKGKFRVKLK
jgi:excinuclease ABC subunit B